MTICGATFVLWVPFRLGSAAFICWNTADCHAFTHIILFTLFLCFLQERFQVKNPPHTYIQKLKGYLDPAVTRKVRGIYFHFLLPFPIRERNPLHWRPSFLCIIASARASRKTTFGDEQHKTQDKSCPFHVVGCV